jgi:hypothetical protein
MQHTIPNRQLLLRPRVLKKRLRFQFWNQNEQLLRFLQHAEHQSAKLMSSIKTTKTKRPSCCSILRVATWKVRMQVMSRSEMRKTTKMATKKMIRSNSQQACCRWLHRKASWHLKQQQRLRKQARQLVKLQCSS